MRKGWLGLVLLACGNTQATPATPQPAPSASTAPEPTPTASASAAPSVTATATAADTAPAPTQPLPTKSLVEILSPAKVIKLTFRTSLDTNETKSLDVKSAAAIKAVIDDLGGDQHAEGPGPGYMPTFELKFVDKDGNPLATVSLFSSATMSDSNKKYGKINVADGTYGGITVAKYEDLQKKLRSLGVTLP